MRKLLSIVLSAFLVLIVLAGCTAKEEQVEGGPTKVKIGVLAPLTGTNAEYGKGFEVAANMALEDIIAAGGLSNGVEIEIVVKDSKGDAKEGSDIASAFGDDSDVMAILGDFTSSSCMATAPIVDQIGLTQLSPTASHPDYAGMSEYCFGIMGKQSIEAPYFANKVSEYLGAKTVGAIYINSDWGLSSITGFKSAADKIGLEIIETVNYVQDEKDFSSLITKLQAADPEVVVIFDQGAVPQIINQIRGMGWDIPIATLGPGTSAQLLELTGENAEGIILPTPFFFDPTNDEIMEWHDEFLEKAGFVPTVHPACAYDAFMLLAKSIETCGDEVTREKVRDNLAAIEYEGITGPIKFDAPGDIARQYMLCEVIDGEYVVVSGYGE